MIILKFGGTSVSSKERVQTICDIVSQNRARQPIVVVSAIRGVTDLLLSLPVATSREEKNILQKICDLHVDLISSFDNTTSQEMTNFLDEKIVEIKKLLTKKSQTARFSDRLVSYGEIISSFIISRAINASGIASQQVIATDCIITDDNFGSAEFLPEETKRMTKQIILPLIRKQIVPVVTGFIGQTKKCTITTLGRGGSDYSAAILGYALKAQEIQIWTDVDGIYSADPRLVPDAKLLPTVSYREASELAAFGAKVLHPRTIRPAIQEGIPVRVLNTLHPHACGTLITKQQSKKSRIAAIASKKKNIIVNLYTADMLFRKGFLEQVFSIFAKKNISVDLVSVSEVSLSISLENTDNLQAALAELQQIAKVTTTDSYGMISLVGEGIGSIPQLMKTIFSTLDRQKVTATMISQSAADINFNLVLPTARIDEIVIALHKTVIQGGKRI